MPTAPVLVTEADAATWTGRPGTTIRRWAHERRITKHGSGRGNVRYDLLELSPAVDGVPAPVPPLPTVL